MDASVVPAVLGSEEPSTTYSDVTPEANHLASEVEGWRSRRKDRDDFWCKTRKLWTCAGLGATGGGSKRRFLGRGGEEDLDGAGAAAAAAGAAAGALPCKLKRIEGPPPWPGGLLDCDEDIFLFCQLPD